MSVVGGRRADLLGHAEVLGELVDLGLVEMRDRLHVGGAVAALDEEALVVLEPVRRADDGVVEPVGVVVLEHLARALLEVRRGDHLAIGVGREPRLRALPLRRLRDDGEETEALAVQRARQHDLGAPVRAVVGNHAADRLVPAPVAAGRLEQIGVMSSSDRLDADALRREPAQGERVGRRVRLRHEQPQDPLAPEGEGAEGAADARVHAAREPEDGPPAPQPAAHGGLERFHDLGDGLFRVEPEDVRGQRGLSLAGRHRAS